jgi:hypothetical protein
MRKAKQAAQKPTRNLSTFKATHDDKVIIPNKIRAALDRLQKNHGDQAYVYELTNPPDDDGIATLKMLTGLGERPLAAYRDQFAPYWVEIKQDTGTRKAPRRVWFATPTAATKARGGPVERKGSAE